MDGHEEKAEKRLMKGSGTPVVQKAILHVWNCRGFI